MTLTKNDPVLRPQSTGQALAQQPRGAKEGGSMRVEPVENIVSVHRTKIVLGKQPASNRNQ